MAHPAKIRGWMVGCAVCTAGAEAAGSAADFTA